MEPAIKQEAPEHPWKAMIHIPTCILPHADADFVIGRQLSQGDAKRISQIYQKSPKPVPFELLNEAEELAQLPTPDERLVGLVGDTGAGKSSLVCALLQTEGIAIVDGAGEAVTCSSTYYRDRQWHHYSKYTVHCLFHAKSNIEEVLETYLDDLNAEFEEGDDESTSSAELERRAQAAEDVFSTLFGEMDGFDLQKLSFDHAEITKNSAMRALGQWASLLQWPGGIHNGLCVDTAETEENLQDILTGFRQSGLWPLIRALTIFLDAPLLRSGVVLVDLPGYNDANLARVRIAEETQAKCHDIFVVLKITRASDCAILHQVVKENTNQPKKGILTLQTITAVCTHSAAYTKDIEKYANCSKLRPAKDELAELTERNAPNDEVLQAQNRFDKIVIEGRNKKVDSDMRAKHGSKLGEGMLTTFCIDSALFMENKTGLDDDAEADISGIRRLQHHVECLPARALFRVHNAVIGSKYRAMLYSFETWVLSSRAKPSNIDAILPEPEALREFGDELKYWSESVIETFLNLVTRPLRQATASISKDASRVVSTWKRVRADGTIRCVCRKQGCHIARGNRLHDWNQKLIACFEAVPECNWTEFENQLRASLARMQSMINEAFQKYPVLCERFGAPAAFLHGLRSRHAVLDDAAALIRDDFLHRFGLLQRNFTVSQAACYVRVVMRPTYLKAAYERGKGAKARRLKTLEENVHTREFVLDVCDMLHDHFVALTKECSNELIAKVDTASRTIEAEVNKFQGDRNQMPLFRLAPELGEEAESLLVSLKQSKLKIDELAEPARKQAVALFGPEILFSNRAEVRAIEYEKVEDAEAADTMA